MYRNTNSDYTWHLLLISVETGSRSLYQRKYFVTLGRSKPYRDFDSHWLLESCRFGTVPRSFQLRTNPENDKLPKASSSKTSCTMSSFRSVQRLNTLYSIKIRSCASVRQSVIFFINRLLRKHRSCCLRNPT